MRGGEIGGKRFSSVCHCEDGITSAATCKQKPSSDRGRTPGFLRMAPVDPGEQITELRRGDRHRTVGRAGHRKRPRSSRLVNRHAPWPSCQITFKRSPRRPRKQNRWPLKGSRFNISCTCSDRLAKPFLMSVWPVASHTRTPVGIGIIAAVRRPPLATAAASVALSTAPAIRIRVPVANSISIVPPPPTASGAGTGFRFRDHRRRYETDLSSSSTLLLGPKRPAPLKKQ